MKRKVWDITVKDNPNRVIMGENDEFYTTDTEAFLVFNLQDKDFQPQSAMLTLENRNDGSLKSEEVSVVGDNIAWEMPERYIEHSGNWQAQLVYEQMKGDVPEKYTSGVMAFTVNSHIKDKKKPSLVEIENWEKFIADGTELIETWQDMEDLREANEMQRQANYQELLDTGVLQTNINEKLEGLEEQYAPKLTEVTSQLAHKANESEVPSKYEYMDFYDATEASLTVILSELEGREPVVGEIIKNLVDGFVSGTLSNANGSINPSESLSTTEFIEVNPSAEYVYGSRAFDGITTFSSKVARYTENKTFISTTDFIDTGQDTPLTLPLTESTHYVRIVVSNYATDEFFLNIGDTPYYRLPPETEYDGGFWNSMPTPPLREKTVRPNHLSDDTMGLVNGWKRLKESGQVENLAGGYIVGSIRTSDGSLSSTPTDMRVTENFIPIDNTKEYTFGHTGDSDPGVRFAFYDSNYESIEVRPYVTMRGTNNLLDYPTNTQYIRLAINEWGIEHFFINSGDKPYFETESGESSGFSEIIPDGVINEAKLSKDVREKLSGIEQSSNEEQEQPFPKKPFWEVVDVGTTKISHLSSNGKVLYASQSSRVMQSLDEGETWEEVCQSPNGMMVRAIRDLDDGELLFTSNRNPDSDIKAKVYKTNGYHVNDLSSVGVVEVLEADNINANFNDEWGLEAHHNIVVASEYGRQGTDGASCAYLSTDFGGTFTKVFDQKTTTAEVEGAPNWTENAHTHTVHYDRYWNRIWLAVGDRENCATYYSDDLGSSWHVVKGSVGNDAIQYTGITSYPEGVFFGSDRVVDGVYVYRRSQGRHDGTIELLYDTERVEGVRTLVYNRPFRKIGDKYEITYFTAVRDFAVDGELGSIIVAFKGMKGHQIIFDATEDLPDYMGEITSCVGSTAYGNILFSVKHSSSNDYALLRTKAPVWETLPFNG